MCMQIYIALVYVPPMCVAGWYSSSPGATLRERATDAGFIVLLETLVAVATLVYCSLMMPLFFTMSGWLEMAWLCLVHPLYFEVTTGYVVRRALQRNRAQVGSVLWFVSLRLCTHKHDTQGRIYTTHFHNQFLNHSLIT